jgi:transposase-like protein
MPHSQKRRYCAQDKLRLVLGSYAERNVLEFCRREGVDPSTVYAWRRELARAALDHWRSVGPGRPRRESSVPLEVHLERDNPLWAKLARDLARRGGLAALLGGEQ